MSILRTSVWGISWQMDNVNGRMMGFTDGGMSRMVTHIGVPKVNTEMVTLRFPTIRIVLLNNILVTVNLMSRDTVCTFKAVGTRL